MRQESGRSRVGVRGERRLEFTGVLRCRYGGCVWEALVLSYGLIRNYARWGWFAFVIVEISIRMYILFESDATIRL